MYEVHRLITDLYPFFGYASNDDGTCNGFIMRWFEACFLGQEEEFEARINKIVALSCVVMMERIKEKILQDGVLDEREIEFLSQLHLIGNVSLKDKTKLKLIKENEAISESKKHLLLQLFAKILKEENAEFLVAVVHRIKEKVANQQQYQLDEGIKDILAFYESQQIYQNPDLINTNYTQQDIEVISTIASSNEVDKLNNLTSLYSAANIFAQKDCFLYFESIQKIIIASKTTEPIAIALDDMEHTIGLMYSKRGWLFKDINQYVLTKLSNLLQQPGQQTKPVSLRTIIKNIKDGLNTENNYFYFNAIIISTNRSKQKNNLIKNFAKFKSQQLTKKTLAQKILPIDFVFMAAYFNHPELINKLVEEGINLNQQNEQGETPAWCAARRGNDEVINQLGFNKADLNITNIEGLTPAWIAAECNQIKVIAQLGKYHADLNTPNHEGATPCWIAVYYNYPQLIEQLGIYHADLNSPNNNGVTPAFVAAEKNYVLVLIQLGKYHADLNTPNKNGETPCWIAAHDNSPDIIEQLALFKADLNRQDKKQRSPVYIAAKLNNKNALLQLAKHGANLNETNWERKSPCWIACCKGNIEMVKILIQNGADATTGDIYGRTPLWIASCNGYVEIIGELAKSKDQIDFDMTNYNAISPMMMACQKGLLNVVQELIKYQAKLDIPDAFNGQTPAYFAAEAGHTMIIDELAKHQANLSIKDHQGRTPAWIATLNHHISVITKLGEYHADLESSDRRGFTPLMVAAAKGYDDIVKELMKFSVDINKTTQHGATALWIAAENGHLEVIKALIKHPQIDLIKPNNMLVTPTQIAHQKGHAEVANLLQIRLQELMVNKKQTVTIAKYPSSLVNSFNTENITGKKRLRDETPEEQKELPPGKQIKL